MWCLETPGIDKMVTLLSTTLVKTMKVSFKHLINFFSFLIGSTAGVVKQKKVFNFYLHKILTLAFIGGRTSFFPFKLAVSDLAD